MLLEALTFLNETLKLAAVGNDSSETEMFLGADTPPRDVSEEKRIRHDGFVHRRLLWIIPLNLHKKLSTLIESPLVVCLVVDRSLGTYAV